MQRLLIANRGEIAVRIAQTAHRLGIDTVGVYSEPDANALHVDTVDTAVALGGTTAAESYLNADAIIEAAVTTECDALHPGYGFLAENADFAEQVIGAGLTWVGPLPEHIRLLGDKISAKAVAVAAGVPTTPIIKTTPGTIPTSVPLPALIKAAAGGGGRGMRIVRTSAELPSAIEAAAREAKAAFGDGTVFIEPYIERGRHIEVQVFGDSHGSAIHLGERECSIQRRNQKIIEESPSLGITAATRAALCDGALALVRHVGYTNAGTVEFMVGPDGTVNFLEVNTRLQVEHPVTEAVTGLDLVELQLRIAQGEPLPITQDNVNCEGHAIEVRLVAECPATGWLPSTGVLTHFEIGGHARVDTGVRAGTEISPYYDSMIAKVTVHAASRTEAAQRMRRVLRSSVVSGVDTNLEVLAQVMAEPDYLAARTPTSYLDDHPQIVADSARSDGLLLPLLVGATVALAAARRDQNNQTGFAPAGWRNMASQGQRQIFTAEERTLQVEYRLVDDPGELLVGPWPAPGEDGSLGEDTRTAVEVRLLSSRPNRHVIEVDGVRHVTTTEVDLLIDDGAIVHVRTPLCAQTFVAPSSFVVPDRTVAGGGPICPLPGTVLAVQVAAGQAVGDGDVLMIVEAMKMEHKITATADSVVTEVHFAVGDRVDAGDVLVTLDTPH